MKNVEIIAKEALEHGIYTEDEIKEMMNKEGCVPLHTYSYWKDKYGMLVKHGEHAVVTTELWRRKKNDESDDLNNEQENKPEYYLQKAFLFSKEQVERVQQA